MPWSEPQSQQVPPGKPQDHLWVLGRQCPERCPLEEHAAGQRGWAEVCGEESLPPRPPVHLGGPPAPRKEP